MKGALPGCILLSVLVTSLVATAGIEVPAASEGVASSSDSADHVRLSDELAVRPGPEAWTSDVRPTISVLIDQDLDPVLSSASLTLDGERLTLNWEADEQRLWSQPRGALDDGPHSASVAFRDGKDRLISGTWSFAVDTEPPGVELDPLPHASEDRLLLVRGTVLEEHLGDVKVNGFTAIVEDNLFRVQVLLWPGMNEVVATATDLAGNRGLGVADVRWLPAPPSSVEYAPLVHENGSFVVQLPTTWEVREDFELEPGQRADLVAYPSSAAGNRPSVSVISRRLGGTMTEPLLLGVMDSALQRLGTEARIQVVSRPRLVNLEANALVAQFSVLETRDFGPRIFVHMTGLWSHSLQRLWLVVGSLPADQVGDHWHAVEEAVETFAVIEPPPLTEGPLGPADTSVSRAVQITVAGIVFVGAAFVAALYARRRRRGGRNARV